MELSGKGFGGSCGAVVPNVDVSINKDAQPDKRSYRVNFDKFSKLGARISSGDGSSRCGEDLRDGLEAMQFRDHEFRTGELIRLVTLKRLRENGQLTDDLVWKERRLEE